MSRPHVTSVGWCTNVTDPVAVSGQWCWAKTNHCTPSSMMDVASRSRHTTGHSCSRALCSVSARTNERNIWTGQLHSQGSSSPVEHVYMGCKMQPTDCRMHRRWTSCMPVGDGVASTALLAGRRTSATTPELHYLSKGLDMRRPNGCWQTLRALYHRWSYTQVIDEAVRPVASKYMTETNDAVRICYTSACWSC